MNEVLNDFVIVNGTNVSAKENETLEQQTKGQHNDFEKIVDSESQNQVKEINIDDKNRKEVDKAVLTVENRMHDPILTAMDKVVITRSEMAVKSITDSLVHGPSSEVQNPDRRDFLGNAGNTTLRSCIIPADYT